jgi:putative sterol carrier protein
MQQMQERLESLRDNIDPVAFSAIVKDASEDELAELMRGEHREAVLDEIFARMPARLKPNAAAGVDAVLHWRIGGRPDGGDDVYEVTVRDGACQIDKSPSQQPQVTFKVRPAAFLRLIAGATNGMKLVLARKLSVEGDIQLAMRTERLFDRD